MQGFGVLLFMWGGLDYIMSMQDVDVYYDWFGIYTTDNASNPQGPEIGKYRVLRGGSWSNPPEYLRSTMRRDALPTSTSNNIGFRCAAKK